MHMIAMRLFSVNFVHSKFLFSVDIYRSYSYLQVNNKVYERQRDIR